tara:strand:+ start:1553 stop:1855 length:303 start_codon:yes stop_codon:yes gene_type:complete
MKNPKRSITLIDRICGGDSRNLLSIGIIGTVVAALCCFTPVLVLLFGAVGLSALTGYLDYVLIPALLIFIGLTFYAVFRKRACDTKGGSEKDGEISEETK